MPDSLKTRLVAKIGGRGDLGGPPQCEQMWDFTANSPHTSHTLNPVEVFVIGEGFAKGKTTMRTGGRLADIAPRVLALMGLPEPVEMTGESLVV